MKSNSDYLELVAASKRSAAPSQKNSSGSGYLDLYRKRVRCSGHALPGSNPTALRSAASPKPASYRPRINPR